jgi:hypothetical protein
VVKRTAQWFNLLLAGTSMATCGWLFWFFHFALTLRVILVGTSVWIIAAIFLFRAARWAWWASVAFCFVSSVGSLFVLCSPLVLLTAAFPPLAFSLPVAFPLLLFFLLEKREVLVRKEPEDGI